MIKNYINIYDFYKVFEIICRNPQKFMNIISRLPLSKMMKVKATWSSAQEDKSNWWDVPAVMKRWNYLITGDEQVDYCDYIAGKYLIDKKSLRGLSLGCGGGGRELRWAQTNKFARIDAYDISDVRIQQAIAMSEKYGFSEIINYKVKDAFQIEAEENSYDVIFGEGALHHFSPLETIMRRAFKFLKPGGCFIVNEFVGPSRFQWTDRQLVIANSLLDIFPERYKLLYKSKYVKKYIRKPSILSMVMQDPSEAIESSKIIPLMHDIFDVREVRGYGGNILHLLFCGISHHFISPDDIARHLLDICFEVEDLMLECGDISDDFIVAVCTKP